MKDITPKEKAKELVNKFYWDKKLYAPMSHAKANALICVDDRLKEIEEYFENAKEQVEILALWNWNVFKKRYWEEVKQEINKQ